MCRGPRGEGTHHAEAEVAVVRGLVPEAHGRQSPELLCVAELPGWSQGGGSVTLEAARSSIRGSGWQPGPGPSPCGLSRLNPRQARPGEAQELNQATASGHFEHAQLLRDEVLPLRLINAHALLELDVGGSLGDRHFEHTPKLAYQVLLRAEEFVALLDELLRLLVLRVDPPGSRGPWRPAR